MLVFLLPGQVPFILWVVLGLMVYLTWAELKNEPGLDPLGKLWWCLLVFIINLPGFIVMRVWLAVRRRRRAAAGG